MGGMWDLPFRDWLELRATLRDRSILVGYIYADKQVTVPCIEGAVCDNCGKALKKVWEGVWSKDMQGARSITLSGGYGTYRDELDINLVLCKDCADELARAFSCFDA